MVANVIWGNDPQQAPRPANEKAAIEMQPEQSSNIAATGYDEATEVLAIQFVTGAVYAYKGVPPATWKGFQEAPSKGKFFARHIRGEFPFEKHHVP